jgi:protease IV
MRYFAISLLVLAILLPVSLPAQPVITPYHMHHDFLMTSTGAFKYGLYGFDNPAVLSYVHQPDFYFTWTDVGGSFTDFNKWGLFAAVPHFSFGMIQQESPAGSMTDYRLSTGFGNRSFSAGLGYGWSGGDTEVFGHTKLMTLGFLMRPSRYVSLGAVGYQTFRGKRQQVYTDLAIRPLGNELITLFGDFSMQNEQTVREGIWSAGVVVEPLPGIRITGRAFEFNQYTLGFSFNLGRIGVNAQQRYDDGRGMYSTYGVRLGAYDRTIMDRVPRRKESWMHLDLHGNLRYRQFRLFDSSNTLHDILSAIDQAQADPSVSGIVVNLSDMNASRVMKWEVRDRLKDFQRAGKRVVVFFDRGDITDYHLASVADVIVMDPQGMFTVEGFISGGTYIHGTLGKLGIAAEEWRFFEYKSAFEMIARDEMSDADREQRQRIVDQWYELVRSEVAESRGLTDEEFDRLVNEVGIFTPDLALQYGLVDTLARNDKLGELVAAIEGTRKPMIGRSSLRERIEPFDNRWSEPPQIAVIYALGVCDMDDGIAARRLVKDIKKAANDGIVKAIVFRVDSPGGDPLASDVVTTALREAMDEKPVIVSQGAVAASGGYWISMYSDAILAAPNTITGSIGVIGGWVYNDGFKERTGLSTDFVKRGTFADLGFGARLPLIGVQLPDRNLTENEYAIMQNLITNMYKQFVGKVAEGRGVEADDIEPYAEGRIWSGWDGREAGLVDGIGGLTDAIRLAREKAGIGEREEVTIVEYPEAGLIDPGMFAPRLFGVRAAETDPFIEHIRFRVRHNGRPLMILPLEYMNEMMYDY